MQALASTILFMTAATVLAGECSPTSSLKFNRLQSCPTDWSLALLQRLIGSHPIQDCLFHCAKNASWLATYRSANGTCYFATSVQMENLFSLTNASTAGECVSYAKVGTGSAGTPPTVTTPIVSGLDSSLTSKLLILFDFRKGTTNLVNAAKYSATLFGSISRDSLGAHFPGGSADYIEVDNNNNTLVPQFLSQTNNFTFFVRLTRQTNHKQVYHYFYDCSTNNYRGFFGDQEGVLWVEHLFPSAPAAGNKVSQKTSSTLLRTDNTPQTVSAGAVFLGNNLSTFYMNGSFIGPGVDSGQYTSGIPTCLRLGYQGSTLDTIRGLLVCYAIGNGALTLSEIQQLDNYCQT